MASYYIYLISSLPMLHFLSRPPFTFERFLEICKDYIPEKDFFVLSNLAQVQDYTQRIQARPVIRQWVAYDTALRNELVKVRSSRKHIEATAYLRPEGYVGPSLASVALAAYRNPSIIEAEKFLDEQRWNTLEELAFGHYFDLDFLVIYAYKLLILGRWERVRSADAGALLEKTLQFNEA